MGSKPRVSIGLPVFNGENYLREALDSILSQTYTDFELIIIDNASTDQTQQICQKYSAKDNRIRYYRNKQNIGAMKNFNNVFRLSSGEYFKWIAHDDVYSPTFLAECVDVLDRNPSVVVAHSKTACINKNSKVIGAYHYSLKISSQKPHERFGHLLNVYSPAWAIFGLMRSSALKKTPLLRNYIGSDMNLLAEISLMGQIYEIPKYLFFRRAHPEAYSNKKYNTYQEEIAWWTKKNHSDFLCLTYTKRFVEFFRSINRVPLKRFERWLCYGQVFKWFFREGWVWIFTDLYKTYVSFLFTFGFGRKIVNTLNHLLRKKVISIIEKKERMP